ncbi:hypothetical protein CDAR_318871, partial [Caerostris darwini]
MFSGHLFHILGLMATSAVSSRKELGSHQGVLREIWHGIAPGVVWKWMFRLKEKPCFVFPSREIFPGHPFPILGLMAPLQSHHVRSPVLMKHSRTNGISAVPSREEPSSHEGVLREIWRRFRRGMEVSE